MQQRDTLPELKTPAVANEQNVYVDVYRLLVVGMVVSTTLFVIGLGLALAHPQYFPLSASWVRQQYHWNIVLHGLRSGDANSYLMIATIILILTPVARVIVSTYAFFVDRDYQYVVVTSIVLLVMLITVVTGILGLQ